MSSVELAYRQIRAVFTDATISVYQAYSPSIAVPAVAAGRFVAPFKRERMTWIKPSFLWMMYRSGVGDEARAGTDPRNRDHPGRLRMGPCARLPQPLRP